MGVKQKTPSRTTEWTRTIFGEPASKANSRILTVRGGKPRSIKSSKALKYLEDFIRQCPILDPLFEEDVHVELHIHYASRRPDLDESVILDALQGRVYRNDRQVKSKAVRWGLDQRSPRVDIRVSPLAERLGPSGS